MDIADLKPGSDMETNICVGIDETGRLLHYKRGHHRLAIAHALGIDSIPINVHCISAAYLQPFIDRRLLLKPGYLAASLRAAVDHAFDLARRHA